MFSRTNMSVALKFIEEIFVNEKFYCIVFISSSFDGEILKGRSIMLTLLIRGIKNDWIQKIVTIFYFFG